MDLAGIEKFERWEDLIEDPTIDLVDVVTDFKVGVDHIAFEASPTLAFSDLLISQGTGVHAADTIIQSAGGDYLGVLVGVNANQVTAAQFSFR